MKEGIKVPQYLHKSYQVLFFELEEIVLLMIFLFLGLTFSIWFYLLMIPMLYITNYIKKRYPRGALKHIFYMLGIITFKNVPTYFETKFYE